MWKMEDNISGKDKVKKERWLFTDEKVEDLLKV